MKLIETLKALSALEDKVGKAIIESLYKIIYRNE